MKRSHVRILSLAVVLGVIGLLIASKTTAGADSPNDEAAAPDGPNEVVVTTHTVEPTTLVDGLTTVGSLKADESMEIKNEVAGKLMRIAFEEGQQVSEGDLLLQMRNAPLRAQIEVKKQRRKLLEKQVERQRKVLETGGVTQQRYDETVNELAVLEAEIQQIRSQLDETVVRAPFDGVIGLREVSAGAILAAGTRVATLRKLDPIELTFTVPERFARHVDTGDEVRFRTHSSDNVHTAEVFALEPAFDENNRALRVLARAENPERNLRPGGYAQVRVTTERVEDALTVPTPALETSGSKTSVWLRVDGKAVKREVETGLRTDASIEITDGLSPGAEVVVTGRQNVEEGATLKVDTSADAMNVDEIAPDPERTGMRNKWFSEEELEESSSPPQSDDSEQSDQADQTGGDQ